MAGSIQHCDILIEGACVVTMDDDHRVIQNGTVAVKENRIVGVGSADDMRGWTATRCIDAGNQALIPGLIDTHNHLFQLAGRGMGDGMALWKWLGQFMLPLAADIRSEEAIAVARLGALEAASSGTTTLVDNHYAPADPETTLSIAQALHDVGLRGVVARGMFGPYTAVARDNGLQDTLFRYSVAQELDTMRQCLEAWRDERVRIWPSPINVIYNDLELVQGSVELAREYGVKWQTHCSEAQIDPEVFKQAYGSRPFVWMAENGLLDSAATFAHAIWLDEQEVALAGGTDCGIAHNPMSNQYLASGAMRLGDLRQAGARIGIGTDGAAGHLMDLFQIMRQVIYVQRLFRLDPEATNAHEAFELATVDGAKLVGIDAGQIIEGKLADLVLVDIDQLHMSPCFDVISNLVYCASGRDVRMTMVDGRVVYERGEFTRLDRREVLARAREHSLALMGRLESSGF